MYSDYFTDCEPGGLTNPYSEAPAHLTVGRRGRSALAPGLAALGVLGAGLSAGLSGAASADEPPERHLQIVASHEPGWAAAPSGSAPAPPTSMDTTGRS